MGLGLLPGGGEERETARTREKELAEAVMSGGLCGGKGDTHTVMSTPCRSLGNLQKASVCVCVPGRWVSLAQCLEPPWYLSPAFSLSHQPVTVPEVGRKACLRPQAQPQPRARTHQHRQHCWDSNTNLYLAELHVGAFGGCYSLFSRLVLFNKGGGSGSNPTLTCPVKMDGPSPLGWPSA